MGNEVRGTNKVNLKKMKNVKKLKKKRENVKKNKKKRKRIDKIVYSIVKGE